MPPATNGRRRSQLLAAANIAPEAVVTPEHRNGTVNGIQDERNGTAPDATPAAAPSNESHGASVVPEPAEARRGLLARLRGTRPESKTERAAGNERADERLLTLGGFDVRPSAGASAPASVSPAAPERALAELVVTAGTHAGLRVPLGEQSVTLTAGAGTMGEEIARVWPYGDSFALRVVGDAPVRVNGDALVLPVVMLDDGNQIDTGSQTLAFHRLPASN